MTSNCILKILCCLPIILVVLYFIPFLGICLILLRYFIYSNKKRTSTPIILIIVGIALHIPKLLYSILNLVKINVSIPCLNDIINAELYNIDFIKYSKLLITVGVIFLILSFIFKSIFNKVSSGITKYIRETEKRDAEISQKNDMLIKIKQEKAKNTSVVYCPYCGADNILTSNVGTCKYCRRKIQIKNK